MKKFFLFLIMSVSMLLTPISLAQNSTKQSGLMLDISRRFYSVETIKQFIDDIAQANGTFLHLHFADHENYALESTFLNQRAENAIVQNGIYINPKTHKPFLTYEQIDQIIRYAQEKQIELIPEVDSPAHIKGILTLLRLEKGEDYVNQIALNQDELNLDSPESLAMMKTLVDEVCYIFGYSAQHFHIGGDEFNYASNFIRYVNALNQHINQKGLITRMWNDGLLQQNIDELDKNIEITYWSFDGDAQEKNDIVERRATRVSLPALLNKGFKALNYNSYYLYFIPKDNGNIATDAKFALNDLKQNWQLLRWDGNYQTQPIQQAENLIGAVFSIWGEHAGKLSDNVIHQATSPLIQATIIQTNAKTTTSN